MLSIATEKASGQKNCSICESTLQFFLLFTFGRLIIIISEFFARLEVVVSRKVVEVTIVICALPIFLDT